MPSGYGTGSGPSVEAKESAKEAATDVATAPDDADSLASLRRQFKKLLDEDQTLANDLTKHARRKPDVMASTPPRSPSPGNVIAKAKDNGIAIGVIGGDAKFDR